MLTPVRTIPIRSSFNPRFVTRIPLVLPALYRQQPVCTMSVKSQGELKDKTLIVGEYAA